MIARMLIFTLLFSSGVLGIVFLEPMSVELLVITKEYVEIGPKEKDLFRSLFNVLYIELIFLGVYALFFKNNTNSNKDDELSSFIEKNHDVLTSYLSTLSSAEGGVKSSVLNTTLIISVSLSIAVQITVTFSDIELKLHKDVKEYIDGKLKTETATELSHIVDNLSEINLTLSDINDNIPDRIRSEVTSIINIDDSSLLDNLKTLNESTNIISTMLSNISNRQPSALTNSSYNEGVIHILSELRAMGASINETTDNTTEDIITKLSTQNIHLENLNKQMKLANTSGNIMDMKTLQCAKVKMMPALSKLLLSEDVLRACGI